MFKIAASVLALSLMASAVHAQTAAPTIDPQRLALARQIFEVQGGAQNATTLLRTMENSMMDSVKDPEAKKRMAEVMDKMVTTFMPRLFDQMAGYYAQDFTEGQLKDILVFYQSPTGQALKTQAPVLAQQMTGSMIKLMPTLQLSVLDKVCSQVECSPEQQQQLAALKQAVPPDQRF
jgi:hypothetical protein